MKNKLLELQVRTSSRCEMKHINRELQQLIASSGVQEGLILAHVLHTTAAITINENADPDVKHDMLLMLDQLAPNHPEFRHAEGNSDSHVKASLLGNSVTIPISSGRLLLGTWQGVYFCEFDGPRQRKVAVRIMGD